MILLGRIRRSRRKKDQKMEDILARATEVVLAGKLFLNPNLHCTDVAKAIGTNRTYLWEALGRHGFGFQDYLSKFRVRYFIEHASLYKNLPCSEIAEQCGFNGAKFLSKYLKQMFGVSLSDYMKYICRGL